MNNLFELMNRLMISSDNEWIIEVSSCGEKILDENWPQGDNGKLAIPISDCWKDNAQDF